MRTLIPTAAAFLPEKHDLSSLREAAQHCEGCPLYANATQTVFGAGPARADVMMVGEQPGDVEDRRGKPFVGPAGHLLDAMMEEAGIPRQRVYVTNAVKHFNGRRAASGGCMASRIRGRSSPAARGSRRSWRRSSPRCS